MGQAMKTREPRQKVVLKARMRSGAAWSDVAIVDVSSRGLGLQSPNPPPRGTFVEFRKGQHVIVAKIVWSTPQRFGALSQDRICLRTIMSDTKGAATAQAGWTGVERRAKARQAHAWKADRSRHSGRAMEFVTLGIVGIAGAVALFGLIQDTFAQTIAAVETGLSPTTED